MSDIDLRTSQFPEDTKERAALAERIADKVRALRLERDSTPDGPGRKSQTQSDRIENRRVAVEDAPLGAAKI